MLHLAEEAFDKVALPIERLVDAALDMPVALRRDVGANASQRCQVDKRPGIVATVGDEIVCPRQALDERNRRRFVGSLPRRKQEPDRKSCFVDNRVDLGTQSSTRTTDGVIRAPLFPPAACWWARMIELSIRAIVCGERSARASKIFSQIPALAHRL